MRSWSKEKWKGRRLSDRNQWILAAVLAIAGLVLILVRIWGMRFSGFLMLGLAAVWAMKLLLNRWAETSRKGRRWSLVFRICLALVLVPLILSEVVVLNKGGNDLKALPADAVIVLGAGVNGTEPSLSLETRLEAALEYLEYQPDIPAVLTGGTGYGEEISEAQCMYNWLTERGVDPERLILEEQAENTAENFAFSRELLAQAGVDVTEATVAVVTNDFHIARSELIASRQGYSQVYGVAAVLPWVHLEVNYYLREAFALIKTFVFD